MPCPSLCCILAGRTFHQSQGPPQTPPDHHRQVQLEEDLRVKQLPKASQESASAQAQALRLSTPCEVSQVRHLESHCRQESGAIACPSQVSRERAPQLLLRQGSSVKTALRASKRVATSCSFLGQLHTMSPLTFPEVGEVELGVLQLEHQHPELALSPTCPPGTAPSSELHRASSDAQSRSLG